MTYRGVYRDGIVVLHGDVDLENGARVDVNPIRGGGRKQAARSARAAKPAKRTRSKGRGATSAALPGFGMWKDRWPRSMSSADIARELRQRVSRRLP